MQALRLALRPTVSFRVAAVTRIYGDTVALWNVDLEGRSGQLVAIQGANGSGKSTLLRTIAGLAAPTRGQVAWTVDTPGARPRIGLLGHASHLFEELTATENVVLAARLAGVHESIAIDLLDRLGVSQWAAARAGALSAGTRRRVGLARVLATEPDAILVDEPFAGLDSAAADRVQEVLAETRARGRIVVIATHDDARSDAIATGGYRLDRGRLHLARPLAATRVAP